MRPHPAALLVVVATAVVVAGPQAALPQEPPAGGAAPPQQPTTPAWTAPPTLAARRAGVPEDAANKAIGSGLAWLRRHRSVPGQPKADSLGLPCPLGAAAFQGRCRSDQCTGLASSDFDVGTTALAALAFLGAGTTHKDSGPDAEFVRDALAYLVDRQDVEGYFGHRTNARSNYNHAAATMAVAEALWLTGDEKLVPVVTNAANILISAQSDKTGWRYGFRDGDGDASATAWAMLALSTCRLAGVKVDPAAFTAGAATFERRVNPDDGTVGYVMRVDPDSRILRPANGLNVGEAAPALGEPYTTDAAVRTDDKSRRFNSLPAYRTDLWSGCTAAATAAAMLDGVPGDTAQVQLWIKRISVGTPRLKDGGFLDLNYLLHGSIVNAQKMVTGAPTDPAAKKTFKPWKKAAVACLTESQTAKSGACSDGSWDPALDPFGCVGGRVYSTSMAILALQAPTRFPKIWGTAAAGSGGK